MNDIYEMGNGGARGSKPAQFKLHYFPGVLPSRGRAAPPIIKGRAAPPEQLGWMNLRLIQIKKGKASKPIRGIVSSRMDMVQRRSRPQQRHHRRLSKGRSEGFQGLRWSSRCPPYRRLEGAAISNFIPSAGTLNMLLVWQRPMRPN